MQLFSADSTKFFKKGFVFVHKNIEVALIIGRAVFSTANQPKYQILFRKNVLTRDLYIMTL